DYPLRVFFDLSGRSARLIKPSLSRSNRNLQHCSTRVASGPKMSHAREPKPTSSGQSTNSVLMVRPSRFYPNPETATDNAFQRRQDIVDELRQTYRVTDVIDYSNFEEEGRCLEGTGSLVLDHVNKLAYVSLSKRSASTVVRRFADDFGYEPVTFTSIGLDGQPVYHTNVMMCVGTEFALVGLGMITNQTEREQVRAHLEASGKDILELEPAQVANFAGNAIELHDGEGQKLLVLSARAIPTFTEEQRASLTCYARLIPLNLPTIEMGGGSARCMIATIHLPTL